jgi:hypothetical protein
MAGKSTMREFWAALTANWLTAMSGPVSVLFVIVAFFVPNEAAKYGFAIAAIICFGIASYRMWRAERSRANALEKENAILKEIRPELELIFSDLDPRCVRDEYYWFEDKPLKARHWQIGVKNKSLTKSADDLTIRARHSWFVECAISTGNGKAKSDPIVYSRNTLEPQAVEFFELFAMGPKPSQTAGDVFKRAHDFVIEARARDAVTVTAMLRYEPTEPPIVTRQQQATPPSISA